MSERGLERNYVAAQAEAEEEARARAPSPCLRGHDTRKGGEIRKKKKTSVVAVTPYHREVETQRRQTRVLCYTSAQISAENSFFF